MVAETILDSLDVLEFNKMDSKRWFYMLVDEKKDVVWKASEFKDRLLLPIAAVGRITHILTQKQSAWFHFEGPDADEATMNEAIIKLKELNNQIDKLLIT